MDGDLVEVVVVDGGDAEHVQELFDEPVRGAGENITEEGQFIQQGGVVVLGGGGLQGGEFGFDAGAFGE